MKHLHYGYCILGVAVAAILLVALGVSTNTLSVLAVALVCPLMMYVMMRTMMGERAPGSHHDDTVEHGRTR